MSWVQLEKTFIQSCQPIDKLISFLFCPRRLCAIFTLVLTLNLFRLLSADSLCKQLDPDQA